MKKNIISLIIILFFFLFSSQLIASDKAWSLAQEGNKIILIRHSLAPGGGDPSGFKLNDCKTQRNLNRTGIKQSKQIGKLFKKNKVPVDQVLSSQWCRCKDTAKYAFKKYKTFDALNSFFSPKFQKNKQRQIIELSKYLNNWQSEKNLILVTHYVVILEKLNKAVSSGEIVVVDKKLNFLGSIIEKTSSSFPRK